MGYRLFLAASFLAPVLYTAIRPWYAFIVAKLHAGRLARLSVNSRGGAAAFPATAAYSTAELGVISNPVSTLPARQLGPNMKTAPDLELDF